MRFLGIAALVTATALVAGCGTAASDAAQQESAPARTTATAAQAPSATAASATVGQYASIVAERKGQYQQAVDDIDGCLGFDDPVACGLRMLILATQAETLGIELLGANNPQGRRFIGPPPPEIAELVARTADRVGEIRVAYSQWENAGCADSTKASDEVRCEGLWFKAKNVAVDISARLDAWQPYL